jgi:hypothetical protein
MSIIIFFKVILTIDVSKFQSSKKNYIFFRKGDWPIVNRFIHYFKGMENII